MNYIEIIFTDGSIRVYDFSSIYVKDDLYIIKSTLGFGGHSVHIEDIECIKPYKILGE